jgi:hypothetical protein
MSAEQHVGPPQKAKDREGQAMLLSGEPGIGKSRITRGGRAGRGRSAHTRRGINSETPSAAEGCVPKSSFMATP